MMPRPASCSSRLSAGCTPDLSAESEKHLHGDIPLPLKRWDGLAQRTDNWDCLHRDPEMYFAGGDCLVYLPGQTTWSSGPSFKLPLELLTYSDCEPLLDQVIPSELAASFYGPRGSPSVPPREIQPRPTAGPRKERSCALILEAPQSCTHEESIKYHLTTRNFFAWLVGIPLVAIDLASALLDLKLRLDVWRDIKSNNDLAMELYVKEQRYDDLRDLGIDIPMFNCLTATAIEKSGITNSEARMEALELQLGQNGSNRATKRTLKLTTSNHINTTCKVAHGPLSTKATMEPRGCGFESSNVKSNLPAEASWSPLSDSLQSKNPSQRIIDVRHTEEVFQPCHSCTGKGSITRRQLAMGFPPSTDPVSCPAIVTSSPGSRFIQSGLSQSRPLTSGYSRSSETHLQAPRVPAIVPTANPQSQSQRSTHHRSISLPTLVNHGIATKPKCQSQSRSSRWRSASSQCPSEETKQTSGSKPFSPKKYSQSKSVSPVSAVRLTPNRPQIVNTGHRVLQHSTYDSSDEDVPKVLVFKSQIRAKASDSSLRHRRKELSIFVPSTDSKSVPLKGIVLGNEILTYKSIGTPARLQDRARNKSTSLVARARKKLTGLLLSPIYNESPCYTVEATTNNLQDTASSLPPSPFPPANFSPCSSLQEIGNIVSKETDGLQTYETGNRSPTRTKISENGESHFDAVFGPPLTRTVADLTQETSILWGNRSAYARQRLPWSSLPNRRLSTPSLRGRTQRDLHTSLARGLAGSSGPLGKKHAPGTENSQPLSTGHTRLQNANSKRLLGTPRTTRPVLAETSQQLTPEGEIWQRYYRSGAGSKDTGTKVEKAEQPTTSWRAISTEQSEVTQSGPQQHAATMSTDITNFSSHPEPMDRYAYSPDAGGPRTSDNNSIPELDSKSVTMARSQFHCERPHGCSNGNLAAVPSKETFPTADQSASCRCRFVTARSRASNGSQISIDTKNPRIGLGKNEVIDDPVINIHSVGRSNTEKIVETESNHHHWDSTDESNPNYEISRSTAPSLAMEVCELPGDEVQLDRSDLSMGCVEALFMDTWLDQVKNNSGDTSEPESPSESDNVHSQPTLFEQNKQATYGRKQGDRERNDDDIEALYIKYKAAHKRAFWWRWEELPGVSIASFDALRKTSNMSLSSSVHITDRCAFSDIPGGNRIVRDIDDESYNR